MQRAICSTSLSAFVFAFATQPRAAEVTPQPKPAITELRQDLSRIRKEVETAEADDARYSGGLIKGLIATRLEVLKINAALVEQRIHALESGARIAVVVNTTRPDLARATELGKEIETQQAKVAAARTEADRYSGGLVQAMAEMNVATARSTLAMLEQQYLAAKYGVTLPPLPPAASIANGTKEAVPSTAARQGTRVRENPGVSECLKIETFDSSVLSTNDVFTELAWKVDVKNSCAEPFGARVTFTVLDKDEFELDSDSEDVYVPANETAKARGKMLLSPPEKARRMAKQGARISTR